MGTMPTKEEMQEALRERIGGELLQKYEKATVAVCGLGGLGSNIAISLARAGIGKLILIDFDTVDITNMNRQQYKVSQIGMAKCEALRDNLLEIAPYIETEIHHTRLDQTNYGQLLRDVDVICEAFDKAEEKSKLVDFVIENMPDKYLVSGSGMASLRNPNAIKTRRLTNNFYICGDFESDVDVDGTLFAPRVMLCAAHQATTVLRILAGETEV
ncbi:MAG: sulfur carrier protein ThiS adenylyltransferase ThiF [Eubacteriaceae bacterium]|nr:sulfur carrier protein ThiS adenylyltransferase ThiF [Eubacteriaceae bacterium]